jgi:hypothetical protein
MLARALAVSVLAAPFTLAGAPAPAQSAGTGYEKLIAERAPALVNIKFTMKVESEEQESEVPGVIIERTGLVLTSNDNLRGLGARFGQRGATASNMKVMIGADTEGVEACVVARDSELGLAWVQITSPAEGGYPFVDFAQGAQASAGQPVMVLSQLSKFFDRAHTVTEGVVSCVTLRPRKMLIPSLALATADWGVPVFDAEGRAVGMLTILLPETEELVAVPGGPGEILKNIPGGKLVLPADEVAAATKRAKEAIASGQGEPEPAPEPAPAIEPATPK